MTMIIVSLHHWDSLTYQRIITWHCVYDYHYGNLYLREDSMLSSAEAVISFSPMIVTVININIAVVVVVCIRSHNWSARR